jgi:polyisoprenoid-binding protein YceI
MEGTGKPEYGKCVEISTKAALREMMLPGVLTIGFPIAIVLLGKLVYPENNQIIAEMLGGYMAGVTVSGVLWAVFQNNAGGAWDNAKKSFEAGVEINGEMTYKGSEAHKAAVTGDTVGDPFKDTSGPSMNILIKLMSIVSLVIAPYIVGIGGSSVKGECCSNGMMIEEVIKCNINGQEYTCTSKAQCDSIMSANMKDIAEVKGNYMVDGAHSSVSFSIKHIISNTKGSINVDSGYVNLDNTAGSKIYIRLDMKSINTQNSMRDSHLKDKPEFFDVAKHTKAVFESSEIVKNEGGIFSYTAKGKLTIKGITKDVDLNFNYVGTKDGSDWSTGKEMPAYVIGFDGETIINRTQFGIGEGGGLGEDVKIDITLEAIQPK